MKFLLDTHCWLWWCGAPQRLNAEVLKSLCAREHQVYFSAASSWEIAIKYALGKMPLSEPPEQYVPARLTRDGILPLPVEHVHALRVATLPLLHRDPFDRLLVAQAQVDGLTLITADPRLELYDVEFIRAGR